MLKRAENTVDASIDQTFRAAMPGEQTPSMRGGGWSSDCSRLAAAAMRRGLFPALGAFVQARERPPGTTVQALSFRDGALELKMAAPECG